MSMLRLLRFFPLLLLLVFTSGCHYQPAAATPLSGVKFSEAPHLVQRDGEYYLRYAIDNSSPPQLKHLVYAKTENNKAYYFFSIAISHPEFGGLVERPLSGDGFTNYAKQDAVYWLNPDGSEIKLEVK